MKKTRVLFVCVHNSNRSQIAEAFLNDIAGDRFEARSAGLEPGELNPHAVVAMKEIGIDISGNKTRSVFDLYKSGALFDYVITVCDKESAEKCPVFPGITKRLHWGFRAGAAKEGSDAEKLEAARRVRDEIRSRVEEWIKEI